MTKAPISNLQRKIKEQSKKNKRAGNASHMESLEQLSKANNFSCYDRLQKMAQAETRATLACVAKMLPCQSGLSSVYRVRIGQSIWSLRYTQLGQLLNLDNRPPGGFSDGSSASDLGINQVLVKAINFGRKGPELVDLHGNLTHFTQ